MKNLKQDKMIYESIKSVLNIGHEIIEFAKHVVAALCVFIVPMCLMFYADVIINYLLYK